MTTATATGGRIVSGLVAALFAATAVLFSIIASASPARSAPGCNLGDLFNDGENAVGALTSPACESACSDGIGCSIAAGVAGGVAALGSTGQQICQDVDKVGDDINAIKDWLAKAGVSSDVLDSIQSIQDIPGLDPLAVAECGCQLEQGFSQFLNDLGDCLCDLVNWIPGVNCNNCTPPPPIQANCANPTSCFVGSSNPACQTNNTIEGCHPGPLGTTLCPGSAQPGPSGTFVSTQVGDSNCPTTLYCFCPKPLVPTWTSVPPLPPSFSNASQSGIFTCACPDGTWQAGTAGGIPICLCDYTNQPPKVADTPQGRCPMNLVGSCQPNQIVVKNQCVTPCQDPTMGMTPDGACCDPNQVNACGLCCKPPSRPVNGTCITEQTQ